VTSFGVGSYTAGCATITGSMGPCSTVGDMLSDSAPLGTYGN
jgi:hypothetical protein